MPPRRADAVLVLKGWQLVTSNTWHLYRDCLRPRQQAMAMFVMIAAHDDAVGAVKLCKNCLSRRHAEVAKQLAAG